VLQIEQRCASLASTFDLGIPPNGYVFFYTRDVRAYKVNTMRVEFAPLGDQAVRVQFADPHGVPSIVVSRRIRAFCRAIENNNLPGVVEWIPAYVTVAVVYRPQEIAYHQLVSALDRIERTLNVDRLVPSDCVVIPTLYGGEYGPDLGQVAQVCGLTAQEVVLLHSSVAYHVHMIGFAPGFGYLGILPEALQTPRRSIPRQTVPAGSVAIAGSQTGVYSIETPGGWNIIGRTPLMLYCAERSPASILAAGDTVRFESVTRESYDDISRAVAAGEYKVRREAE